MNTGLSSRLHPRKSSFVLSWSSASATRTTKAQDTKRAFKPNFPNFPVIRPKAKVFEPQQIWYQNAPIGSLGKLLKHPCGREIALLVSLIVRKSLEFFCKQARSCIIPTRKADPNIFLIALKQDYIDAQYGKLGDLFPFSMFYCANEGKMFKNLTISQKSTLLDVMQIKFHDLLLNVTLIC